MSSMYDIDLLRLAFRQRLWILAATFITTAVLIAAAYSITPVYRARAVLAPAASMSSPGAIEGMLGQLGGVAALAGLGATSDQRTKEALAVLGSRQFTDEFIRENQLIPVLFAADWDPSSGKWKGDARNEPTASRAFKKFDREVRRAYVDKKSGLVFLEIDWVHPEQAADWANMLVARLNETMRERAIAEANSSIQHLSAELERTGAVEIKGAINRLIETQVKQRMLATVNPEYAFRVIDPAIAPDRRDPIRPRKMMYALAGPLLGLMLGLVLVLGRHVYGLSRAGAVVRD